MRERFGQLAKKIIERAVGACGALRIEHEVPIADAQSGDVYFVPEPGKEAQRAHLGWLDAMTREPCLLEILQRTPGPVECRDNIRKQLTLDHAIARGAEKKGQHRPPLLRLWQVTTARPGDVLEGYGLTRADGWPAGFWMGARLLAMGVVVLSEVPRQRDTLLLRLLGRGRILKEAIEDLKALPPDAPEREVAMQPLVALKFEMQEDPGPDDEARAVLMAVNDLYEQWERRVKAEALAEGKAEGKAEGLAKGKAEGLMTSLVATYEARLGPLPKALRKALAAAVDEETIGRWVILFATASAKEIAAAVRKGQPSP